MQMQQVAQPASRTWSVLPVLLLIFLMIGAVLGVHYKKVYEQRELYNEYLALNAWRAPTIAAYEAYKPVLVMIENIDPEKPQDWKRIDAEAAAGATTNSKLRKIPRSGTMYSREVDRRLIVMLDRYDSALTEQRLIKTFPGSARDREMTLVFAASSLQWDNPNPTGVPARDFQEWQKYWIEQAKKLNDQELRRRVVIYNKQINSARNLREQRKRFEKALQTPDVIPDGLDMEYVKKWVR